MKSDRKLTDFEKEILWFFIQNESENMRRRFREEKWGFHDPQYSTKEYFYVHVSGIWNSLERRISKPTIKKCCEALTSLGVLSPVETRTTGPHSFVLTRHYHLRHEPEVLKRLVELIQLNYFPKERIVILSQRYFDTLINEELVRTSLAEKGVTIIRSFDILDVELGTIPAALNLWFTSEKYDETKFRSEIAQDIEEIEDRSLRPSYLFNPGAVNCRVPVVSEKMYSENFREFAEKIQYGYVIEGADRVMRQYPSIFTYHREVIEREKLILPILALIKSSPNALALFLSGQWEPFQLDLHEGNTYSSKLLLDLITEAITDIGRNVVLPENFLVDKVHLNHFNEYIGISNKRESESALLSIDLATSDKIFYDIRYSAQQVCQRNWNFSPSEMEHHPLGSPLIVKEPHPDSYKVTIRVVGSQLCIQKEQVRDGLDLIQWLISDDVIANCIFCNFSYRLQNLIQFYPREREPSKELIWMVLDELNRVIKFVDLPPRVLENDHVKSCGAESPVGYSSREYYHRNCTHLMNNSSILCEMYPSLFIKRSELKPSMKLVEELVQEQMNRN